MYNPASKGAEEFMDHEEILASIQYARENKNNRELIESLLARARDCKGLSHREALVLLECEEPDLLERIFRLAREIKQKFYGNRIVMFAPLYLSNYCVNGCTYCPYHFKNKHIVNLLFILFLITMHTFIFSPQGPIYKDLEFGSSVKSTLDRLNIIKKGDHILVPVMGKLYKRYIYGWSKILGCIYQYK